MAKHQPTKSTRVAIYSAAKYLGKGAEDELSLRIPFDVYMQDPLVGTTDPTYGFDEGFDVLWEPGISDGPTSARFAIVDYNGDTEHLAPMAQWDEKNSCFLDPNDKIIDRKNTNSLQFDQVNVWAILQRALEFFEGGKGLGRRIPFGFDGNRLIVVPHAGYGKNAFYDRQSKSLQFYYFDHDNKRIKTCLSTDIVNHEFGHAVLDGIRPFYIESSLIETGAFHEFVGDLTAILLLLRNNDFRRKIADKTGGNLSEAEHLSSIAEEFGHAVSGYPYLRTAKNKLTMSDITESDGPHKVSEVMTGAMFDVLLALSDHYLNDRKATAREGFWYAIDRMQRTAVQPLDLLPPADVTFRDYALAVLRMERISNPTDPYGHHQRMLEVFEARGILTGDARKALEESRYVYDRLRLGVFHDIDDISRSRAAAYRFLDDNRDDLLIPHEVDVVVADLYDAVKRTRQSRRLPRQIVLVYIWREQVLLEDDRFGQYAGQRTNMLCGGTLVFDEQGNVLSWARKPGTLGGDGNAWSEEKRTGEARRNNLLDMLARRIQSGQVGATLGSSKGLLGSHVPPITVSHDGDLLKFQLSPHLSLAGEDHDHYEGGARWQVTS